MEVFVGAETTIDVGYEDLQILMEYEKALSEIASDKPILELKFLGIICIIMNDEIAPPFPGGLIFKKSRGMIDVKVNIDFDEWVKSSPTQRIKMISSSTKVMIEKSKSIPADMQKRISNLLLESVERI